MSKSHRDNHAARMKRGPAAFAKKAKRRKVTQLPCLRCGTRSRPSVLIDSYCPPCKVLHDMTHIRGAVAELSAGVTS